jgi:hypothetical protein
MMTGRRALLLVVALVVSLAPNARAQERAIRIRNYDALLTVHSDGSLDVTEQLTIGFAGQWNGIVRDLSLQHNTAQGRRTKLDVTIGYITDDNGQRLRVEESGKENGRTRSLKIYIPGASDASRTIIIRYKVANAIRFYFAGSDVGAIDELYWNVTGSSWTMPIDSVHARVVLLMTWQPRAPRPTPARSDQSLRTRRSRMTAASSTSRCSADSPRTRE